MNVFAGRSHQRSGSRVLFVCRTRRTRRRLFAKCFELLVRGQAVCRTLTSGYMHTDCKMPGAHREHQFLALGSTAKVEWKGKSTAWLCICVRRIATGRLPRQHRSQPAAHRPLTAYRRPTCQPQKQNWSPSHRRPEPAAAAALQWRPPLGSAPRHPIHHSRHLTRPRSFPCAGGA